MRRTKQHWTDRHGFVLSAASAGLLAWALMSIFGGIGWAPCLGAYVDLAIIRYDLRAQS